MRRIRAGERGSSARGRRVRVRGREEVARAGVHAAGQCWRSKSTSSCASHNRAMNGAAPRRTTRQARHNRGSHAAPTRLRRGSDAAPTQLRSVSARMRESGYVFVGESALARSRARAA
jgi:hypothetical protein